MKWLGTKRVPLKSIVLPGNFSATRAAPRIRELATSIREHGTIQLPVVQQSTMRLVAGHDRIAALMALKEKHVEVRFVECDEREFRRMQIAENLHRRSGDDHDAMVAEYARLEEEAVTEACQPDTPTQRIKEAVNKNTAAGLGKSVEAVKQARKRAARKERAASPEVEKQEAAPAAPALPPSFEAFGLPVAPDLVEGILGAHAWLTGLEGDARRIVGEITKIGQAGKPVAPAHLQAMRQQAQALGHAIREAIPASLCWYCKARIDLVTDCNGCGGTGVVGRHAGDHVPQELRRTDDVHVAVKGEVLPLSAHRSRAPERPRKNGKPIHVEVVHEVGAAPRELTIEREATEEELF